MGKQLFTNNASSTLSGTLPQGGTTLVCAATHGSRFPTPTEGDFFYLTIYTKDAYANEQGVEIVKVTARAGDVMTVERDVEDITGEIGGFSYDGASTTVYLEIRWTAGCVANMAQTSELGDAAYISSTTLAGYGIEDAYTKEEVDLIKESLLDIVSLIDDTNSTLRLPIFSPDTIDLTAISNFEQLENDYYPIGMTASLFFWLSGASLYMAANFSSAGTVATSPDGKVWTLRTMPSSSSWRIASNNEATVIAVQSGSANYTKSSDGGVSWAAVATLPGTATSHGAAVGSRFVLPTNTTSVYVSTDGGATWTTQTAPATTTGKNIYYVGGVFVFYSTSTANYYTSPTGETGSWTARTASATIANMQYDADGFLLIDVGGITHTSTDGITFTSSALSTNDYAVTINGIKARLSSNFGDSCTYHNNKRVARGVSSANWGISGSYKPLKNGSVYLLPAAANVGYIDHTAPDAAVGTFEV